MIDWNAVQLALWTWVDGVDSGTVIWAEQNAPIPDGAFATLRLASLVQVGQDFTAPPVETGPGTDVFESDITGNREFTLEVQTFGADAFGRAEAIRSSLQRVSVLDALRAAGIVFVDRLGITNVTALDGNRQEERAAVDILFRAAQVQTEELPVIETVEVESAKYLSPDGSTAYEDSFTIPETP